MARVRPSPPTWTSTRVAEARATQQAPRVLRAIAWSKASACPQASATRHRAPPSPHSRNVTSQTLRVRTYPRAATSSPGTRPSLAPPSALGLLRDRRLLVRGGEYGARRDRQFVHRPWTILGFQAVEGEMARPRGHSGLSFPETSVIRETAGNDRRPWCGCPSPAEHLRPEGTLRRQREGLAPPREGVFRGEPWSPDLRGADGPEGLPAGKFVRRVNASRAGERMGHLSAAKRVTRATEPDAARPAERPPPRRRVPPPQAQGSPAGVLLQASPLPPVLEAPEGLLAPPAPPSPSSGLPGRQHLSLSSLRRARRDPV